MTEVFVRIKYELQRVVKSRTKTQKQLVKSER